MGSGLYLVFPMAGHENEEGSYLRLEERERKGETSKPQNRGRSAYLPFKHHQRMGSQLRVNEELR